MTVEMGNLLYFVFIFLCAGITVGLYFLLRHKSEKTIKIVLFCLLIFNVLLHFSKVFYPPYSQDPKTLMRGLGFANLCATSVLFFPIIFLSKSNTWRDYMVYMGILSGGATMIFPEGVLGEGMNTFDNWRFYICHMLLFVVSFLMLVLRVQKVDYHRIWRIPFCVYAMFLVIMMNDVLQSELGIRDLRGDDMFDINYSNESLVWGPDRVAGPLLSWLTPEFMKYVPFGEHAGEAKYWPFFWLLVPTFVYGVIGCFLLCLPFEFKHIKNDCKKLFNKFKSKKTN